MSRARRSLLTVCLALTALGGCLGDPLPRQSPAFPATSFPQWSAADGAYRFYPGDTFRLNIRTAPEMNADLTIGPDGRVVLPSMGQAMAANLSVPELQAALEAIYAAELVDPSLTVTPTGYGSQKIFVGGEVRQPGVFALPGEIDPLQAIVMAGGWTGEARATHVIVMRRAPDGQLLTRVVDVKHSLTDPSLASPSLASIGPLQRFDVVYVTRKPIADQNLFVKQWIRDALPIDFGVFYGVGGF